MTENATNNGESATDQRWLTRQRQAMQRQRDHDKAVETRWSWCRLLTFFGAAVAGYFLRQSPTQAIAASGSLLVLFAVSVGYHRRALAALNVLACLWMRRTLNAVVGAWRHRGPVPDAYLAAAYQAARDLPNTTRLRAIPPEQFTRRWAGFATAKLPYQMARSAAEPIFQFAQRTGKGQPITVLGLSFPQPIGTRSMPSRWIIPSDGTSRSSSTVTVL